MADFAKTRKKLQMDNIHVGERVWINDNRKVICLFK